ncbi:MAG: cytochrome P450 [Alphaproteobacteria bacterium]|nr:cytochrome P450 [Alphaproteobacteria bacterium]
MIMPKIDEAPYLDLKDPGFSIQSKEVQQAREQSWFARTPYGLAILRYEEMKAMIMHPLLRQGSYRWPEHNGTTGLWSQWWLRMMLNKEGADHARLRKLGMPAFSPRLVTSLIPDFQALGDELISNFEADGRCEFQRAFAEPYATRVVCSLIGLSHERSARLAELSVEMGYALGVNYAEDEPRVDAATEEMFTFTHQVVAERRKTPKDDFISALINASEDDDALSEQEVYDMIVLSIFGGIDTTRNQLGLAIQMFLDHPDQWEFLAQNPDLARQAVEEVMRTRPTVTWVTREATEDFEFQGLEIAQGTTLHLLSQSAASDPQHFEAGFDITLKQKPHFGFGGGKHHCIGSPIARGDMTEALKLLSSRLKNIATDGSAQFLPDSGNTGPLTLPIKFEARDSSHA